MRILVAEDDRALRDVLQRGLREAGYVVDVASDGEQALANLTSIEYEVAVLDWRMPKLTGLEVIEGTRKAEVFTPILMLTARDTPSDRVEGLNAGADDYLISHSNSPNSLTGIYFEPSNVVQHFDTWPTSCAATYGTTPPLDGSRALAK